MSVVIAHWSQTRAMMSTDRRVIGGSMPFEGDTKMRVLGRSLLGAVGDYRGVADLLHDADLPEPKTFAGVRTLWSERQGVFRTVDGAGIDALLLTPFGMFLMDSDGVSRVLAEYYAIGSGAPAALGAFYALVNGAVDRRLEKAVHAAGYVDLACSGCGGVSTVAWT